MRLSSGLAEVSIELVYPALEDVGELVLLGAGNQLGGSCAELNVGLRQLNQPVVLVLLDHGLALALARPAGAAHAAPQGW